MSFSIVLQHSASPKEKLTKNITDEITLTGTLKDGSSVTDPVVMIERSSLPLNCNYATISSFGRSYFITGFKSVTYNMWEVSLHVDVLSTYATKIRQQVAIIGKNERSFNLYLNDSRFRCYQNPHIVVKQFPNAFNPANFSLVLAVCAGKRVVQ